MAVEAVPPPSLVEVRVRMFDRHGAALGEVVGDLGKVSWRLNAVGKANFSIAKTDAKATGTMLAFRHRVLIEFDNGLPNWGGVVVPSRRWDDEAITLTLRDGAELLHYRMTDHGRYFEGAPAGTIFEKLILEANAISATGVEMGTVWTGGTGRYKDYHYEDLLRAAQVMAGQTGHDFAIVPVFDAGSLTFEASWYEERGTDKANVVLIEGHNCEVTSFEEQGPIINSWAGVGEGATWSVKPRSEQDDDDSQAAYGLLEDARVFAGVVQQDTLDENVGELLDDSKAPTPRIRLQAQDIEPAAFASYEEGDRVRVQLHSYGFLGDSLGYDNAVRVLSREVDVATGKCELVVEESEFKNS